MGFEKDKQYKFLSATTRQRFVDRSIAEADDYVANEIIGDKSFTVLHIDAAGCVTEIKVDEKVFTSDDIDQSFLFDEEEIEFFYEYVPVDDPAYRSYLVGKLAALREECDAIEQEINNLKK
ncbi:hypothetical protein KASHIRA_02560 [Serratia phage vB_SmaM-Kashira]|nr:hypothetical protein KASHIRA_02560 [Serratia phage vB_SmaM-Kashira]